MRKFKRAEFVVGKSDIVNGVRVNRGDIVVIMPIEFLDNCGEDFREWAADLGIQSDLAVYVTFYNKEDYNKCFIDGSDNPKAELPVHAFSLPDMFKDLRIKVRNISLIDPEQE